MLPFACRAWNTTGPPASDTDCVSCKTERYVDWEGSWTQQAKEALARWVWKNMFEREGTNKATRNLTSMENSWSTTEWDVTASTRGSSSLSWLFKSFCLFAFPFTPVESKVQVWPHVDSLYPRMVKPQNTGHRAIYKVSGGIPGAKHLLGSQGPNQGWQSTWETIAPQKSFFFWKYVFFLTWNKGDLICCTSWWSEKAKHEFWKEIHCKQLNIL